LGFVGGQASKHQIQRSLRFSFVFDLFLFSVELLPLSFTDFEKIPTRKEEANSL
jgi:hypothetical protein